jgi:CheY-like chemotaxis protein
VLGNLFNNALKFTENGKIEYRVSLGKSANGQEHLEFSVIDTGMGIRAQDLENIWKPYAATDFSLSKKYQGLGLGLSIVKSFVVAMGGEVRCSSVMGQGTQMTFSIPLIVPAVPSRHVSEKIKLLPVNPQEKTILVAEDDVINQMLVQTQLSAMGFRVAIAHNGLEAFEMYQKQSFDFVLMDLQMPGMDGFEATRQIKEWTHANHKKAAPIVALTSSLFQVEQPFSQDKVIEMLPEISDRISQFFLNSGEGSIVLKAMQDWQARKSSLCESTIKKLLEMSRYPIDEEISQLDGILHKPFSIQVFLRACQWYLPVQEIEI